MEASHRQTTKEKYNATKQVMVSKKSLYDVLGLSRDATAADITRVYRRLALQYHPDRNPEGAAKFKEISNAYSVLSDEKDRRTYDATGIVPGVASGRGDEMSESQRSAEMQQRVHQFYATYAGSHEEEEDVIERFKKCKGNFGRMIREELLFDNGKVEEVKRLQDLVRSLVKRGRLESTEAWEITSTEAARKRIERAMAKERKRAVETLDAMGLSTKKSGAGSVQELQAIISHNQEKQWADMLGNLEEKYVKRKNVAEEHAGKKKKREQQESASAPRKKTKK